MSWVPLAVGASATLAVLTAIARWLRMGYKGIRTLIGIVVTMRELVALVQEHMEHHKQHDPKHIETLDQLSQRLERLEQEVKDLYQIVPHLRKHVPAQVMTVREEVVKPEDRV